MRNFLLIAMLVLLGHKLAEAERPWTPQEKAQLELKFRQLDKNQDLELSREEMILTQKENFLIIDADGDGFITLSEFMGYRKPGAGRYLDRRRFELRRWSFYRLDFNLDRRLSEEEYSFHALGAFRSMDSDGNSKISFQEFSRLPMKRRGYSNN